MVITVAVDAEPWQEHPPVLFGCPELLEVKERYASKPKMGTRSVNFFMWMGRSWFKVKAC
jgi:hypothetical protein